jgi:pantoate--beta-alanine ligase
MQRLALQFRDKNKKIAFVPTMGYLHEGHLSLIRRARRLTGPRGVVIVSIYVNPTQFGPNEDFECYPRDLHRDLQLCKQENVDIVFAPTDKEMYPGRQEGKFTTYVVEEFLSKTMEGACRPGHFKGVTTVVAKLFNIVQPHIAVFGAKDWQQAVIIKRMVDNLNFPVKIVVAPTVREKDGLALSSRNTYLSPEERKQATILYRSLVLARELVKAQSWNATELKAKIKEFITKEVPTAQIDYVEFFQSYTLQPLDTVSVGAHMALAVRIGNTRLIDNARL